MAELTIRLATAEASSSSTQVMVVEMVHEVGQLRQEMVTAVAQAPAPWPLALDVMVNCDQQVDHARVRVNMSRPVGRSDARPLDVRYRDGSLCNSRGGAVDGASRNAVVRAAS